MAMLYLSMTLLGLGCLLFTIGWIWILVHAFRESVLWGLGVFLITGVAVAFGALRWDRLKVPLILHCTGIAFIVIGSVVTMGKAP